MQTVHELLDATPADHIFLSGDWHLFMTRFKHEKNLVNTKDIISYTKNTLKDTDVFMYLGDISYRYVDKEYADKAAEIFRSLPGIKILILGNHDRMVGEEFYTNCGFDYIFEELQWNKYVFTHRPILMDQYPPDYLNIHAHIHKWSEYNTTDGSQNINVYPTYFDNKPVTLDYLLKHKDELMKDNKRSDWINMGESTMFTNLQTLASYLHDIPTIFQSARGGGKTALYNAMIQESESRKDLPDSSFGIPEDRKFPLDSAEHVKSAIKLFGHAEDSKKSSLAKRIKKAADSYGIEIPKTTQCYKYLEAAFETTDELVAVDTDGVFDLDLSEITWWYVSLKKDPNGVDEEQFSKTLQGAIKQYIPMELFAKNKTVDAYVFTCNGEDDLTFVPMGKIIVAPDLSYQWELQYPLTIDGSGKYHSIKEYCAANMNPIIGFAKPYVVAVEPMNNVFAGKAYAFSPDLLSDKYLVVDENAHLSVVDSSNYRLISSYQFIGESKNIDKLKTAYAEEKIVDQSFIYTALSGKPMLCNDQIDYDPAFEQVDMQLEDLRMKSLIATLTEQGLGLQDYKIVQLQEKEFDDMYLMSDPSGYFYKDKLTGYRTISTEEAIDPATARDILYKMR